jgi:hypothetical protein
MGLVAVECPTCHSTLHAPDEYIGKRARCKGCGQVFVIKAPSLDDSVVSWLSEVNEHVSTDDSSETHPLFPEEPAPVKPPPVQAAPPPKPVPVRPPKPAPPAPARPPQRPRAAASPAARPKAALRPAAPPKTTAAATAVDSVPAVRLSAANFGPGSGLRLSHVDVLGAFFVFPSRVLEDVNFRASMPRCCLSCGVGQGLKSYLVMWTSKLEGRDTSLLRQHDIGTAIGPEMMHRLTPEKLLAALPHVPNMPHPFDLPMPYFICNRCTPAGAIMTHVRPMIEDNWNQCELGIASLKRALEFLVRNLGRDNEDYAQLEQALHEHKADAWRALPLPVRNRIEAWYKAAPGERFLCYVRDSDFAQAEAGLGGLVMTDRRVVFRKARIQREVWMTDRLEISADQEGGHYVLRIGRAGSSPAVLRCDPNATELIRHNLKMMGVNYTFKV